MIRWDSKGEQIIVERPSNLQSSQRFESVQFPRIKYSPLSRTSFGHPDQFPFHPPLPTTALLYRWGASFNAPSVARIRHSSLEGQMRSGRTSLAALGIWA